MHHNFLTARFVPFSAYEIIFFRAVLVCRSSFRELQGTRKCCSPHRREKGSATTRTEFRGRHVRQKFIWVCTCASPFCRLHVSGKRSRAEEAAEDAELRGCFPRNRYHPRALVSPETSRLERALLAAGRKLRHPEGYECFLCTSGMLCCAALVVAFRCVETQREEVKGYDVACWLLLLCCRPSCCMPGTTYKT